MKRNGMACLVAALFGMPMAANAGSVTLYGVADVGITAEKYVGIGSNASRVGMDSGIADDSVFGLKGTENLGDGLTANFVLESNFSMTNGSLERNGRMFGNQASVGLAGDFGSIDFGRQQNVASDFFESIDPFRTNYKSAGMVTTAGATDVRYDNMVKYVSPSIAGVTLAMGYSFSADATDRERNGFKASDNDRAFTTGLRFDDGPLSLMATYDQVREARNASASMNGAGKGPRQWLVGAAYDFEVVKVSLAGGQVRGGWLGESPTFGLPSTVGLRSGDFNSMLTDRSNWKASTYLVGLSAPVGAGRAMASWQRVGADHKSAKLEGQSPLWVGSLGYEYDLSKRTKLYTYAAYTKNPGFAGGISARSGGLGLQHRF